MAEVKGSGKHTGTTFWKAILAWQSRGRPARGPLIDDAGEEARIALGTAGFHETLQQNAQTNHPGLPRLAASESMKPSNALA